MSFFVSILASYRAFTDEYGLTPIIVIALGTLTAGIWAINGFIWLRSQKRPSRSRINFDYAYGLDLVGLHLGYDKNDEQHQVQIGLDLKNVTQGALKYYVESFDIILGDRTIAKPDFNNREGVIPSNCRRTYLYPFFKKGVVEENTKVKGIIRYSIKYGHPEMDLVRLSKKELHITLSVGDKNSILYLISSDEDTDI